jgi:23S rRNA (guanosine2251-2'-O)-methyltransferase
MIWGFHPVREALRALRDVRSRGSAVQIDKVYLARTGPESEEISQAARVAGIPVVHVKAERLFQLCNTPKHQGVAAQMLGSQVSDGSTSRPSGRQGDDLDGLLAARKAGPAFLLLLDGVEDPRNLGAMIRTADAAGVDGVVIPNRRAVGITGTVSKTSAGALAHLPVVSVTNLSTAIDQLKKKEIWVVGVTAEATTSYWDFDFTVPVALVLGGEGSGLHQKVSRHCDAHVSIPMHGHVASLNVSVACALVTYEVVRQRARPPRSSLPKKTSGPV